MPSGETTFVVRAPLERVWGFLSDMQQVGSCISGVEEVKIVDSATAEWTIKQKIGFLTKTMKVRTQSLEQTPPTHAKFQGEGEEVSMVGTIDLVALPDGATQVHYQMDATAHGALAKIMDNYVKTKIGQQTQEFADNVKKKLEAV